MVAWRAAGLNYVRFSQIAAQVTRNSIKAAGAKKTVADATLKISNWQAGKKI